MARLVGAKCPNCGAAVRVDPNQEWVTCDYCRTSSYVETPARRQAANAPPRQGPVIQVPAARAMNAMVLVGVIVPVFIGVMVSGMVFFQTGRAGDSVTTPVRPVSPASPVPPVTTPTAKANYQVNALSVPGSLRAALGPTLKLKELIIYPEYVIFEVQDPQKSGNVDRYTLRDGKVGDKDPVRLSGDEKKSLDAYLFDLAVANFALVPTLVNDARSRLAIDEVKSTFVQFQSHLPFEKTLVWRVHVSGPRDSGFVEYDLAGKMKRVVK